MKELKIHFGKEDVSFVGLCSTADTVILKIDDNFNAQQFIEKEWAAVKILNGIKYINTKNILWFEIIEQEETEEES